VINEIHYKTPEWIEIYNPSNITIYLNNWIIADRNSNDSIKNLTIYNNSYALIVDDKIGCNAFNVSNNSCLEIGNIGSGLNDDGDSIYLYDNQGNLVDSVTYNSSMGANENEMSLQRINFSENNSASWIAFPPSPGKQNFYPATYFEIFSISFPERNFVNNTIKFNITILNRGIKNGTREIGFSIKANSTLYSEESLISVEAMSSKTILFNWTPKLAGNYTICAKANNTLCKRFAVFQLQNASISFNITKGNKKIVFYTNIPNASCTIDYNVSVENFLVACGRMEKEAFQNATLDIGFGKFRVCANARINNFNDIFGYDN